MAPRKPQARPIAEPASSSYTRSVTALSGSNAKGIALNSNPGSEGPVRSFPFPTTAQGPHVSQSWNATHRQIDEGKMEFSKRGGRLTD